MTFRLTVFWLFMGVLAAFGLYNVKYRVQELKVEVAQAETQLREEKKNLHVLEAEWTYLNRPDRLRQLSSKFLDLKPAQGAQLGDVAALPVGPIEPTTLSSNDRVPLKKGVTLAGGSFHAR